MAALLWKILDTNLPAPSYVFGTMHVRDQRAFARLDPVLEAIQSCAAFATEFNLEEAKLNADPAALNLPNGQAIDQLLGEKKYQKARKALLKMTGMDIEPLKHLQPIMLTNVLSESVLAREMAFSMDEFLWRFATEQEKIRLGVETYQEQMEILHQIPMKIQLKSLIDISKNFKKYRKKILKTTTLYEEQNIQQLYKSTKKSLGKLRKLMLYDRNKIMAERIGKMAQEQPTVAAIGAAHLAGKKGVLRLLKKQGFKIKAVD